MVDVSGSINMRDSRNRDIDTHEEAERLFYRGAPVFSRVRIQLASVHALCHISFGQCLTCLRQPMIPPPPIRELLVIGGATENRKGHEMATGELWSLDLGTFVCCRLSLALRVSFIGTSPSGISHDRPAARALSGVRRQDVVVACEHERVVPGPVGPHVHPRGAATLRHRRAHHHVGGLCRYVNTYEVSIRCDALPLRLVRLRTGGKRTCPVYSGWDLSTLSVRVVHGHGFCVCSRQISSCSGTGVRSRARS